MALVQERAKVVVVGGGFSGIAMAIRLKQQGVEDFVVLERADDVGGTWHYNTYPGCRCDVPSHLYSFSFAPNPSWSHTYSAQAEIREYLRRCADEFGIRPHLRTGVQVQGASWCEDDELWEIDTSAGTFAIRRRSITPFARRLPASVASTSSSTMRASRPPRAPACRPTPRRSR